MKLRWIVLISVRQKVLDKGQQMTFQYDILLET